MTSPAFVCLARLALTGGFVEVDRLRGGKAFVTSRTLFVGLQTARHARLPDSWINIFRSGFNFESAASPVLYEPYKAGYQHSRRRKPRLASELCLPLGTIPLLEKDGAIPLEFLCSPAHLVGKLFADRDALLTSGPAP
jgi:hypothetical protein